MKEYVPALGAMVASFCGFLFAWVVLAALSVPDIVHLIGTTALGVAAGALTGRRLKRRLKSDSRDEQP